MKRTPVTSSNVASVGWEPGLGLEVEFTSGQVYRYPSVPKVVFDELLQAESVGKFINANVKGQYDYTKVAA